MKVLLNRLLLTCALFIGLLQCARANVNFTLTPSAVSNTYTGTITLQVTGLTAGDEVVVRKFLDSNTNGIIDAGDLPVQQFRLTDGQAGMVIGGVANFNVPGDTDGAANGQITAILNFNGGDFVQNIVGKYLFKLSSPSGAFSPMTNFFTVTNFPCAQQFTGIVVSNGLAVPNAAVILFPPPRAGNHGPGNPLAGTVADNLGNYAIQMPSGTYVLVAFRSNYVANYSTSPVLTLGGGQTITANLMLTAATASISGQIVDATSPSIGLPGVIVPASTKSGLIVVGFTVDTNGDFALPVSSGQWNLGSDDSGLIVHGYVGYQNGTNVPAGTAGLIGSFYKATTLAYGVVTNSQGQPLAGIDVEAFDVNNNEFQSDATTDANGNYVIGLVGGLGSGDPWVVQVSTGKSPANYIYSQPPFDESISRGTNLAVGQALKVNFTALFATNQITGNVQSGGTNLAGLNVFATSTINGIAYSANIDTDTSGNYSLNVPNGTWNVGVNCNVGSDSLDNLLGAGNYQCPSNQSININNNIGTANFIVLSSSSSALQVTTVSLTNGTIGVAYNALLSATGGQPPYNWSLAFGSPPLPTGLGIVNYSPLPGLSIGSISGLPGTNGLFNFTVQVTDANSSSATQPLSLIINPRPSLGLPAKSSGSQFQFWLTGATNQNYTVQMSTNLATTNWTSLFITNDTHTNSFLINDSNATNQRRFYRILIGP